MGVSDVISKDGAYWSTGITVRYGYSGGGQYGWSARLDFYDDGFANDDTAGQSVSTEGRLVTRYFVCDGEKASGLSIALDVLRADAEKLGIRFNDEATLYYAADGEDLDNPPPDGWRAALGAEAARIGWKY
jgi:hypothetical protein